MTASSWAPEQKPISELLIPAQESIGGIGSFTAEAAIGKAHSIVTADAAEKRNMMLLLAIASHVPSSFNPAPVFPCHKEAKADCKLAVVNNDLLINARRAIASRNVK